MTDSDRPMVELGSADSPESRPVRANGSGRTVVRNFTFMLLSQGYTWSLSIILMIVAPRILGVNDFGNLRFVQAFVGFFALVAPLGMATYIVKAVARDTALAGQFIFNAVALELVWAAVLSTGAIVLAHILGYSGEVTSLIVVFCVMMIITTLDQQTAAAFQGLQRMGGLAFWAAVQETVATALGVFVLVRGWGVVWLAVVTAVSFFVQFVANAWRARPLLRLGVHIDLRLWRAMVRGGLPYLFNGAILVIYGTIDIPILERLAGTETVAWYAIAYQWVSVPAFFGGIVVTALLPSLAARGRTVTPEFAAQANKALRLVFAVGAPVATGIALVSSDALHLLYGGRFGKAVPIMQVLASHVPIVGVTMVLGTVLVAVDRQRAWLMVGIVAAVFNVSANLILIPWAVHRYDNGAIGAALVTVLTEVLVMFGAILLRPPGVLDRSTASFCGRAALSALLMLPAVLAIGHSWVGLKVLVGVIVFSLCAFVFRVGRPSDLRQALGHIRGAASRS
ncbi:MAG: flippase [Ilumatobacteraceae bacterium]